MLNVLVWVGIILGWLIGTLVCMYGLERLEHGAIEPWSQLLFALFFWPAMVAMVVIYGLVFWPIMWVARRLGIMVPRDPNAHYE